MTKRAKERGGEERDWWSASTREMKTESEERGKIMREEEKCFCSQRDELVDSLQTAFTMCQ